MWIPSTPVLLFIHYYISSGFLISGVSGPVSFTQILPHFSKLTLSSPSLQNLIFSAYFKGIITEAIYAINDLMLTINNSFNLMYCLFPGASVLRKRGEKKLCCCFFYPRHFQSWNYWWWDSASGQKSFSPILTTDSHGVLGQICTNLWELILNGKKHCPYRACILMHGNNISNNTLSPQKKPSKRKQDIPM